ncbi:MAG: Crp/Fnr family transcriptional regulator [Phenylobacterium sp.]|nr:Crp/Fnr family transcriptional regulator [Phenylobacterium sp.]
MLHAVADRAVGGPPSERRPFGAQVARPGAGLPTLMLRGLTRTFVPGATIYAQEDTAEFVYQVASGMVRTVTLRPDGRRIVHAFHLAGEIFGLEREALHHCSAEAVCETRLIQCPHSLIERAADVETAQELRSWLLLSRDKTAERSSHLMYGSAFEKLAYFLIDLAWRTQSQGSFELAMSRYDIADHLGLSSETVSRAFSVFRNRGLIATRGRQVTLLDGRIRRIGAGAERSPHWPRAFP